MDFFCGNRPMHYPLWDDKEFTRLKVNITIPELNGQTSFEDEEEIVGIVMLVPHELPLRFHDHNIMAVKLGDSFRRPQGRG